MQRVSELLTTHSTYDYYRADWQAIKDLKEGFPTLRNKSQRYLPMRIGEDEDVYQNRLSCMAYTNLLSENIHRLAAILSSAPVDISYDDADFWEQYLTAMDGRYLTYNRLRYSIYSDLLHFGRLCIAVDNPPVITLSRSRAEFTENRVNPRVILYQPLEVLNWDEETQWVKTLQVSEQPDPFTGRRFIATWKLWTEQDTTTWSTEVEVDIDNVITRVKIGAKWYDPEDKKAVLEGYTVGHGLGRLPVVMRVMKDEEWVGASVYPKCLQHFNIESSWTWAGRYAGIIQRVFTPTPPTPNDNPNLLLEPPDYSQVISDNAHILIGNNFQFVETSGSAVDALSKQLGQIRDDIRDTVNITFASASKTGVEQSGVSKKVDLLLLQNALTIYGGYGQEVDEAVLELSALWAGSDIPETRYNQNYTLEGSDSYLDTADRLVPHALNLAPITLHEFYKKLQHAILPDADEEVKQLIDEDTPTFEDDLEDAEEGSEDTKNPDSEGDIGEQLKAAYDLTDEEVAFILGEAKDLSPEPNPA